ncbi:hypothetical protein OsJ_30124 [Oryza sativa Japonica Group]|uniref:Uncharacterized protein n=1 Tax=Oryza sativa subsp. japonica TaxID=39947 RepID=B9G4R4_ORYSJ|nr:hypothetical protein OsJ_30124 [Oryza sativa Japonica Group]
MPLAVAMKREREGEGESGEDRVHGAGDLAERRWQRKEDKTAILCTGFLVNCVQTVQMRGDNSSIMKSTGGEEDGDASDEENPSSFLLPGQTHGLQVWNDGEPNNPLNPTLTCASVRLWAPAVRLWGPGQRLDRDATVAQ